MTTAIGLLFAVCIPALIFGTRAVLDWRRGIGISRSLSRYFSLWIAGVSTAGLVWTLFQLYPPNK